MSESETILFAGGGTGGHLFPGIAVANELRRGSPPLRCVFVGSERSIEATIAQQNQLEHRDLPVESLTSLKKNPWRFAVRNWSAWRGAAQMIRELKPVAVVGLGGFASAPLVWEARRRKIPVVLLEQNVIPGKTTRWLSRWADRVCVTFAETIARLPQHHNVIVTGNPVRKEIASLSNENRAASASIQKQSLLVLGGSQGADSLNQAVITSIGSQADLLSGWRIIHQTGPRNVEQIRQHYVSAGIEATVEPFYADMAGLLSNASLVISRAGATSLAEFACAGLPMILLPFPHATDDHQRVNAEVFVKHNAAVLVQHADLAEQTASDLRVPLEDLLKNAERREAMSQAARQLARPRAADEIATILTDLISARATLNP